MQCENCKPATHLPLANLPASLAMLSTWRFPGLDCATPALALPYDIAPWPTRCATPAPSIAATLHPASEDPPEGAVLDAHAIALPPNEVVLCPSFWQLPLILQAGGEILHEMFHLRFDPCFTHGPCERKRNQRLLLRRLCLESRRPYTRAVSDQQMRGPEKMNPCI